MIQISFQEFDQDLLYLHVQIILSHPVILLSFMSRFALVQEQVDSGRVGR